MKTFRDYNELRRYVSDNLPSDLTCYEMTINDLIDYATDNIMNYLRTINFVYGQELPFDWEYPLQANDCKKWWELFE